MKTNNDPYDDSFTADVMPVNQQEATKHTQGEWRGGYDTENNYWCIVDERGKEVAFLPSTASHFVKLIAAAPDLLEALVYACDWMEADAAFKEYPADYLKPYNQAKAAIKKATE